MSLPDCSDFAEFIDYLGQNSAKIQDYREKVSLMRNETSILLLQAASLFHPEILVQLNEIDESSRKCDKFIMEAQQLKEELDLEAEMAKGQSDSDNFNEIMQEISSINEELDRIIKDSEKNTS